MGVKILVSGPVRGAHGALFAAASKAQSKIGPVAALFCVGDFFGERVDEAAVNALPDAPIPTYFITGGDVVDNDLADRLAAKNVRWLGRSGCEDVAGLRVGFLGGALGGDFEDDAPADGSDSPHYRREDLETLAIASGAATAGAWSRTAAALAASRGSRGSTRCRGAARQSLRAFDVAPFVAAHFDLDTADGATPRFTPLELGGDGEPLRCLRGAQVAGHRPPPGLLKRKPMAAAALAAEKAEDAGPAARRLKTETKIVEGPARPVYGAPNRPEEPAPWQPAEKKEKRQSIYAPGSSLANPSKKKRKRMGAPHGPQF
ncbi:DNA binding protein [Aureococcus anophagefferens]|nr:DNA binding protein [Aureococcus anophagefferens]